MSSERRYRQNNQMITKTPKPVEYEDKITCDICGKEFELPIQILDFEDKVYEFHRECLFEFWKTNRPDSGQARLTVL